MMTLLLRLTAFFVLSTFFGCTQDSPPPPTCRTSVDLSVQSDAAACLIISSNTVLLVVHKRSGKLDLPAGGSKQGESTQCTAHRETWEETGLNVEVGRQLATTSHNNPIFLCTEESGLAALPASFNAPPWSQWEVSKLVKVNPFDLHNDQLRFKDDLIPLRDAFIQARQHMNKPQ